VKTKRIYIVYRNLDVVFLFRITCTFRLHIYRIISLNKIVAYGLYASKDFLYRRNVRKRFRCNFLRDTRVHKLSNNYEFSVYFLFFL